MSKLGPWKNVIFVFLLCAAAAIAAPAQTFNMLVSFDGTNGAFPQYMSLIQGTDGNLYGTTTSGGNLTCGDSYGCGTVFRITPNGKLTTIYSFCAQPLCADGAGPYAGLVQAIDGYFYGTTAFGGSGSSCNGGCGTVFRITPTGMLTTIYSFCAQPHCADGATPVAALIQATDGNFYGTTEGYSYGTVFRITPKGRLTTVCSFNNADGAYPVAGLIQATDGNFYGTTTEGGGVRGCGPGCGIVFKVTPWGNRTTLHKFDSSDGADPYGAVIQTTDGTFYGTTTGGAANNLGTVFKITPGGTLTTVYSFCSQPGCTDGADSYAGLIQATDGNFYGTTGGGGANNGGTAFKITPEGELTTLHDFDSSNFDGPYGALLQATNGTFYGTTYGGGSSMDCGATGCGTVFSISTGLGSFVSFVRNPAKVGQPFGILGQGFTGTTGVSLSGNPTSFTVKSDTFIEAIVPAGATTGSVTVTTPSGALTSNVPFRVLPQLVSFRPPSGPVGTMVTVTGVSLTQTTGIGFGDQVPATFTVISDTQVTATVPSGAKTGKVGIETQGGIAISSTAFTVTQ